MVISAELVGCSKHKLRNIRGSVIEFFKAYVADAIDAEALCVKDAIWMGQQHDAHGKNTETKLRRYHSFTNPFSRIVPVTTPELCRDDKDITTLLILADLLKKGLGTIVLPKMGWSQLNVSVEQPLPHPLLQKLEKLLYRLTIAPSELLPTRNGEIAFRAFRKRVFRMRQFLVAWAEVWKEPAQRLLLLGKTSRLIVEVIAAPGWNLLRSTLFRHVAPFLSRHFVCKERVTLRHEETGVNTLVILNNVKDLFYFRTKKADPSLRSG